MNGPAASTPRGTLARIASPRPHDTPPLSESASPTPSPLFDHMDYESPQTPPALEPLPPRFVDPGIFAPAMERTRPRMQPHSVNYPVPAFPYGNLPLRPFPVGGAFDAMPPEPQGFERLFPQAGGSGQTRAYPYNLPAYLAPGVQTALMTTSTGNIIYYAWGDYRGVAMVTSTAPVHAMQSLGVAMGERHMFAHDDLNEAFGQGYAAGRAQVSAEKKARKRKPRSKASRPKAKAASAD